MKVKRNCEQCGEEFVTTQYQIDRGNGKFGRFCSRACSNPNNATQLKGHKQFQEHIDRRIQKGKSHYRWNGGIKVQNGYRLVLQRNGKYRQEHRIIAEKVLGRLLKQDEYIHHINGDRADNRTKNFLICDRSYHQWLERQIS